MENETSSIVGNNTDSEKNPAESPAATLGALLREARENLGLSVADVASQIKFAPRQIEALEADDYKHLPEAAFLRGFVRSYAKILHLDAKMLLAAMPQKEAAPTELLPESVDEPFPNMHSVLRQNLIWLGGALLLILIVAVFAFSRFSVTPEQPKTAQVEIPITLPPETQGNMAQVFPEVAETQPASPAMEQQPSEQVPDNATSRAVRKKQTISSDDQSGATLQETSLRLVFIGESWIEVKDRDGNILLSKVAPEGDELTLEGIAPLSVLIGHAPSVELYYKGKQVDLAPYTRRSTDVAFLTLE